MSAKVAKKSTTQITTRVFKGDVLGVSVYRGYARLCDLSKISRADIYDRKENPTGTQRDLSPKHAKDAYDYVTANSLAFWPEVFLCLRDPSAVSFKSIHGQPEFGNITFDLSRCGGDEIAISRVDGNHRLHYADGATDGYPPIERIVSFCLAYGLSLDNEIALFRDINNNQKRMNTSHLDNIEVRLSPIEKLKKTDPELYIAQKLGKDKESPFNKRVFEGGKKTASTLLPLRTLKTGIEYLFSRSTMLTPLRDVEAKYKLVRNYFVALKEWEPDAWKEPKRYILLRGAGLWGACFLGAVVIDRVLQRGAFESKEMLGVLNSGRRWDWQNDGDFRGLSGRGGAAKISEMIASEMQDGSMLLARELYQKIMESN